MTYKRLKRECKRLRLAVARDAARWVSETTTALSHHKVYHHAHHTVYFTYYLFALIEHKGAEAIIAGGLLCFSVVAAIAGE